MKISSCPFKIGDRVIFTNRSMKNDFPGEYGLPNVGEEVEVAAIAEGPGGPLYLVWRGGENWPGGGVLWTDFVAAGTPPEEWNMWLAKQLFR